MRQGIIRVVVAGVSVALLLFGVPLAVVARTTILTEERGQLERHALLASGLVGPDFAAGDQVELPAVDPGRQLAIYDTTLQLRVGQGPATADDVTRSAVGGAQVDGQVDGYLVVAVPVTTAENVVAVVRAATPMRLVWGSVLLTWGVLAALAAAAMGAAVLVARRRARQLSQPLESLSQAAERVAGGDLQVRTLPAGGPEIERVAHTQNAMLDRLTDLLLRERRFSADASHQLRTPLTGLQLGLETALEHAENHPGADLRPALVEGIERAQDLDRTVTEILRLARPGTEGSVTLALRPLQEVLADVEHRWHGALAQRGRQLIIRADPGGRDDRVPGFVAAEVLSIVLGNALQHGHGRVLVSARHFGEALAIDVADEGSVTIDPEDLFRRGTSGGSGSGIGLALARSITETIGGRLVLASARPTQFTLLVPRPHDPEEQA